MADELLIRVYDVGLGDCILCRVPDAIRMDGKLYDFHMLIDCGTWSGMALLEAALANVTDMLPDAADGKKRLDLLVITHEHKDHIAGLDPKLLAHLRIGAIWMNAAMNLKHKQAKKTQKLHAVTALAVSNMAAQLAAVAPELRSLPELFIDNAGAMEALRKGLPKANGVTEKYVHAGQTNSDLDLALEGLRIRVLGPEDDIDGFYLGKAARAAQALAAMGDDDELPPALASAGPAPTPDNISPFDFRQLRARMLSNGLAFAKLSSQVTNNSSVVLLLEWQGRRLLFVGDAEWDAAFKPGKANGAWNVMWNQRREVLAAPVDFLKVGHHGSENATPWNQTGRLQEPVAILDAILPMPAEGEEPRAAAVVSTAREKYETIPRTELLAELGRRVRNAKDYAALLGEAATNLRKYEKFEKDFLGMKQPVRTDLERIRNGRGFVDTVIVGAG